MAYTFLQDKKNFIETARKNPWTPVAIEAHARRQVIFRDEDGVVSHYQFLLQVTKYSELDAEAEYYEKELLHARKAWALKDKNSWDHFLYCCEQLVLFYSKSEHDNQANIKKYTDYIAKIKQQMQSESGQNSARANPDPKFYSFGNFFKDLRHDLAQFFLAYLKAPFHAANLRSGIGLFNLFRVYWVFCRLTLTSMLVHFRDIHILDKIENALNTTIDENGFIKQMESANGAMNILSVALFAVKFSLSFGTLIKHVVFPNSNEKGSRWERFKYEWYKRKTGFANDGAWAVINFLTNFPQITNIGAAAAGWLTAGFLLFDFFVVLWQRHLAKKEFELKDKQYDFEIRDYTAQQAKNNLEIERLQKQKRGIEQSWPSMMNAPIHVVSQRNQIVEKIEQLNALNAQYSCESFSVYEKQQENKLKWHVKSSTYLFDAAAALLFVAGFSASLLFASPVVAIFAYAACMMAVAMYMTDKSYAQYKEKSLRFDKADSEYKRLQAGDGQNVHSFFQNKNTAEQDLKAARREFWFKLLKNAVIPTLIMATMAVCWQAAVVIIAVYVGVELYRYYNKQKVKHAAEQLKQTQQTVEASSQQRTLSTGAEFEDAVEGVQAAEPKVDRREGGASNDVDPAAFADVEGDIEANTGRLVAAAI